MKGMIRWLPLWLLLSAAASAAETLTLPPNVLMQLNAAQQAMSEEKYAQADAVLKTLLGQELSAPAKAYVLQFQGNLSLVRQQQAAALKHFAAAYALKALPAADQRRLLHTVAQLQLAEEQWRKGVESMRSWMQQVRSQGGTTEQIRAEDYLMLAQGHSRLEQWAQVVDPVRTAIRMKGHAPEDWYRLQLAAYFELKQWKGATAVLELLVNRYPQQERYWEQLASVYQIRDHHAEALATLRAAWLAGKFSKERQYIWLTQMFLQQGLPQRAAELLQDAMARQQVEASLKHERLLAQTQLQAKLYNEGRSTLARIAQRKPDYQTWRQLAYLDMQLRHWDAMKRSIDQAVALKPDAAELYLLSGIADINRSHYDQARSSFVKASEHDKTRVQAQNWLNYLDQVTGRSS